MIDLSKIKGFQWDKGNITKNWIKHEVSVGEAEQVFFNEPFLIGEDSDHSTEKESRYYLLGTTDDGRRLFISFTVRKELIRVISARDMSKAERSTYEKEIKKDS
jgi:uncharacterized DUF497 family protein